ncbi:MAG: hydrogenase maturation nickel metallochaperone HypA [Bacilli bacterium]|nr:hydrogenase maturation nickel metallochaperone HypA [Bacilli bacterium]
MHELGLVFHMIDAVEAIAKDNKALEVASITMEIGEVSGVVTSYFRECFESAKTKVPALKEAKLEIVVVEAVSYCQDCKKTYPTVKYGKKCPHCGSDRTYLVYGRELTIREIKVKDPPLEGEETPKNPAKPS